MFPKQAVIALVSVGLLTGVRIAAALGVNKIIAMSVGPVGVALLGTFQNTTAIVLALGGACISQGILVTTAQARSVEEKLELLLAATMITLSFSIPIIVFLIPLSAYLASQLFDNSTLVLPFYVLAVLLIPNILNVNLWNALPGLGDRRSYSIVGLAISAITVAVVIPLVVYLGVAGAIINALVANALSLLLTGRLVWRRLGSPSLRGVNIGSLIPNVRRLLVFSPMAIATVVLLMGSQLIVRDIISREIGTASAGYWQGLVRISEAYWVALAYFVALVAMPRFAVIPRPHIWGRVVSISAVVMGVVVAIGLGVFWSRGWLIPLLFSSEFLPMTGLLGYHLSADVMRGMIVVMGAALTASAQPTKFVLLEGVNAVTFVSLAAWSLPEGGVLGVTQAYLAASMITACLGMWLVYRLSKT